MLELDDTFQAGRFFSCFSGKHILLFRKVKCDFLIFSSYDYAPIVFDYA